MSSGGALALSEAIGDWTGRNGPLYARLAEAITAAIEDAALPDGTRLPAERTMAQMLQVSRATVTQAYEMLRGGGWVQSRQGSGTWVDSGARGVRAAGNGLRPLSSGHFFHRLTESSGQPPINLSIATLSDVEGIFPDGAPLELAELLGAPGHGYAPLGYSKLRETIAGIYRNDGIPTDARQILVTSGAQQAISLLAANYLQPGDAVVVESPTYLGAIDAFSRMGARMIPVPVGEGGARLDVLAEALRTTRPKLVYLMPTFHNPTGAVMPEEARREVARLASGSQVPFVEDNTLADISLGRRRSPAALASYAQEGTVISIGSMAKLYWAGLRVGWVRAPEALITRLGQHKVAADLGSSMLSQVAACKLLASYEQVRARRASELGARLELIERLLKERIPEWEWVRPAGGLSLWIRLPSAEAGAFAEQALRHGVAITPGSSLTPDDAYHDHIRINFVVGVEMIEAAVDRLAAAWAVHRSAGGAQQEAVEVKV